MENKNSISIDAKYLDKQNQLYDYLKSTYSHVNKVEFDKLNEMVIWATSSREAVSITRDWMQDEKLRIDFLSDLTAYDNKDKKDGSKRFILVYQLYSTKTNIRIRVKTLVDLTEEAMTLTSVFVAANWLEREVFDLYGIKFNAHPNLRRIMMDERFEGHPLRKEFPIKQRKPFANNVKLHLGSSSLPGEN